MAKEAVKKVSIQEIEDDIQSKLEAAQKELADLKAKLAEGDEAALRRVSKSLGVDADEVLKKETTAVDTLVEIDLGVHQVYLNGTTYYGKRTVSLATARVIQQAIGDRRMRLLREKFGKDHLVEEVAGRGLTVREIGRVNEYGEKI